MGNKPHKTAHKIFVLIPIKRSECSDETAQRPVTSEPSLLVNIKHGHQ